MGHHSKEDDAHYTEERVNEELGHAGFEGDGSALREGVHNHLGGNDGRVGDIHEGEGRKEKILGWSQTLTCDHSYHNEEVSKNGGHIHD